MLASLFFINYRLLKTHLFVLVAHVTHARQLLAVHPSHGEDDDGFDGRYGPRRQVEVTRQA